MSSRKTSTTGPAPLCDLGVRQHVKFRWRCGSVLLALLLFAQSCAAMPDSDPEPQPHSSGSVILLHGLGRSVGSMTSLERALAARGYGVRNVGYASRESSLEELVVHLEGDPNRE